MNTATEIFYFAVGKHITFKYPKTYGYILSRVCPVKCLSKQVSTRKVFLKYLNHLLKVCDNIAYLSILIDIRSINVEIKFGSLLSSVCFSSKWADVQRGGKLLFFCF